jgi:2-oxo-4-hydroxy-4-carboxy--5-ureidoimidazoline (OHCU) decarboxylase
VIKLNSWFNHALLAPRWGVMDSAADLITRAARYRALAAGVTDEQTRAGLLELAEKYEALAREMKADDPPEAQ